MICPVTDRECAKYASVVDDYCITVGVNTDSKWAKEAADEECLEGLAINGGNLALNECGIAIVDNAARLSNAGILERMLGED